MLYPRHTGWRVVHRLIPGDGAGAGGEWSLGSGMFVRGRNHRGRAKAAEQVVDLDMASSGAPPAL